MIIQNARTDEGIFGGPTNVASAPFSNGEPHLDATNSKLYLAWSDGNIRLKRANLGGAPGYSVGWLATQNLGVGESPVVVAGGSRVAVFFYRDGDTWVRVSQNSGGTFSAAEKLLDGDPKVYVYLPTNATISGSKIVLSAIGGGDAFGTQYRLTSNDGGDTWTEQLANGSYLDERQVAITLEGGIPTLAEIWFARSLRGREPHRLPPQRLRRGGRRGRQAQAALAAGCVLHEIHRPAPQGREEPARRPSESCRRSSSNDAAASMGVPRDPTAPVLIAPCLVAAPRRCCSPGDRHERDRCCVDARRDGNERPFRSATGTIRPPCQRRRRLRHRWRARSTPPSPARGSSSTVRPAWSRGPARAMGRSRSTSGPAGTRSRTARSWTTATWRSRGQAARTSARPGARAGNAIPPPGLGGRTGPLPPQAFGLLRAKCLGPGVAAGLQASLAAAQRGVTDR